ncbi:unnamed protein product [marine sediment metagenome]|uniref:Uncharacterized protein n=1 Tax=marine sediment metagenome TaxID=412755 RepID=X0WP23_9ZZZZ
MDDKIQVYYDHMNELLEETEKLRYNIEHNKKLIDALRAKIGFLELKERING